MTRSYEGPVTYFAPAQRAGRDEIARQVDMVRASQVVHALLESMHGLIAILNERRQIIALNDALLEALGIPDAGTMLGLRPGEAIQCVHAHEMPGGCGTSRYCATCGAAIALVACIAQDRPAEQKCAAQIVREGDVRDVCFRVHASPLQIGPERMLLLFLQDITSQERWAALERAFFHDISNTVHAMTGACDVLAKACGPGPAHVTEQIRRMSERLTREIALQRTLAFQDIGGQTVSMHDLDLQSFMAELNDFALHHPAGAGKKFHSACNSWRSTVKSDLSLLARVVSNMLVNALEATDPGDEILLCVDDKGSSVRFSVWNRGAIPEAVQLRIFQRYYSTKADSGRGIGTFVMKLFGEQFLGGKIGFTSSPADGTIFWLELPG